MIDPESCAGCVWYCAKLEYCDVSGRCVRHADGPPPDYHADDYNLFAPDRASALRRQYEYERRMEE